MFARTIGGTAIAAVAAVAAGACATAPHTIRTGDLVRVTTDRDTVVGRMVAVRSDTLFQERATGGGDATPLVSIRSVEVDRASEKPWARPLDCLVAGTGLALTAHEVAEYGMEKEMVPQVLVFGWSGWNCVDSRPHWRPARIGGLDEDG